MNFNTFALLALLLAVASALDNNQCIGMEPICTSEAYSFQSQTDSPITDSNFYGCLSTQPNPAWYYFKFNNPGNIVMSLTANSDIDFIIWGPYDSVSDAQGNCNAGLVESAVQDCSYSGTSQETIEVNNIVEDKIYVLLITNFANNAQEITFQKTSGTTETDCQIVEDATDHPTSAPSHAPSVTASDQPTSAPTDVPSTSPSTSPSMEPSSAYDNNIGPATNGTYLEESWSMSEPDITYNKDGNWYRLNWTVVGWKDAFETNKHINEDFYDDQCKDDGDHTEYRIESGIVNYPNTGKPEAYKDNWGNIILDFEIRPEILTTQSEIYKDNLDGSGQLDFCVRSSIGYNGTDNQALSIDEQREAGYREINFIESLLTIVYDLTSNYTTVSATVRPKDRVGTTETEDNYSLVAWICDTTTSVTDPATNVVRSYPGQKIETFEQGSIIPVCIRPDTAAYEEGIVMRDVQSFTWTRDSISQPAIVSGTQAANRLTFYGSCDGNHYCLLSSILFADFYATAGIASGDGAARVKFEGSTRRLAEENRLLQEDSSPFDINVALAESEDGPILAKTAGGASLGFTALVSFIALSAGLLLA